MKPLSYLCLILCFASVMLLAQSNPVPLINNTLVPDAAAPGGQGFTLTVNGTGFVSSSVVNWNGGALATNFVSASQLTATVPAANIASGNTASVTVVSPNPGGGTSNVSFFEVREPFHAVGFGQSTLSSGNFPYQVVTLDANGDGKLDLAAAVLDDAAVGILLGNGDGTFQPQQEYSVGGYPFGVVAGDFNNDGKIDLAIASVSLDQSSGFISLLLGNGDGTFQLPTQDFNVGTNPFNPIVGDFNGDGSLDIAVIVSAPSVGTSLVAILLGNGDGTFQNPINYDLAVGYRLAIGDFNRDGKLDLAVPGDGVNILLGNGDGTFQNPVNYPTPGGSFSLVTGDFNSDGKLDLAVTTIAGGSPAYQFSILLGNGDGTFQNHVDYVTPPVTEDILASDVNGDGILDVVTTNGTVFTFLGKGDGTFAKAAGYFPESSSLAVGFAAGDFNGDGKLDLVTANEYANTFSVALQATSVPSQTLLNFGKLTVGKSKSMKVSLTNIGTSAFSISSITVTGAYAADFSERNNCGLSLAASASCTIRVTFAPQTHAQMSGAVTIVDGGVVGSETITLEGNGLQ